VINNSEQKAKIVGVLFKSGSYLVVRPSSKSSWTFPAKSIHRSGKTPYIIPTLFREEYSLEVEVKDSLANFLFTKEGKETLIIAYWVDCDEAEDVVIKVGEYRWVPLEEMLLLTMKDEHLLIRNIIENLSFA